MRWVQAIRPRQVTRGADRTKPSSALYFEVACRCLVLSLLRI